MRHTFTPATSTTAGQEDHLHVQQRAFLNGLTNGRTDWSLGLMAIMSHLGQPSGRVEEAVVAGKFTNALLANVEFPMTTMAGRASPWQEAFSVRARQPWTADL